MKIQLLGTGTPTPSLTRMSSGYMVKIGNDVLLFDHGPGAHHRMLEAGTRAADVTHLFFSHLHYDHCLDYARLVLTHWDQGAGQIPEIKVVGPKHTQRMTELLFTADGVFGPDILARTKYPGSLAVYERRGGQLPRAWPAPEVTEIKSGGTFQGNGWTVTAQSVIHQQPYLECFGYRLDSPEGSFVYSGDSGPCKAMVKLAQDCDVLVHMCHYISGTALNEGMQKGSAGHMEVANTAAAAKAKNLVVTHITEQMDAPGVREQLIREMSAVYQGNIFWGEDLMKIPLTGPAPRVLR